MAKAWAKKFYKSRQWEQCRGSYYISQHGLCERCDKPGLIVHHKILLTPENIVKPEIALNYQHLELLCQDCHNKEHMSRHSDVTAEGLIFDKYGDLVRR